MAGRLPSASAAVRRLAGSPRPCTNRPNKKPPLTCAVRTFDTGVKNRFELPTKDIAALLDIAASSVVRIIAETQPLLTQLDHPTQPVAAITTATQFNTYLAANGVVP